MRAPRRPLRFLLAFALGALLCDAACGETMVQPGVAQTRARKIVTVGEWSHGVPACSRCHGPSLRGVAPVIPALAGRTAKYLELRLQEFQTQPGINLASTIMHRVSSGLSAADRAAIAAYIAGLEPGEVPAPQRPAFIPRRFTAQSSGDFSPPPESAIPTGPDGDMIWKGQQIFDSTGKYASRYVGDALNCSSCHLDRGRRADSSPMWAAFVSYPKYRSKNHKVNTLIERIQGCFEFSMNGKAPAADSDDMVALVAYFRWLATGLPVASTPKGAGYPPLAKPEKSYSIKRGARVYASHCALCHADDGAGREADGAQVFPPLWGPRSFNWGAGMGRISTAAAFIEANMPYGAPDLLSNQQAWDVAAFVDSHPRPQDPRYTGSVATTRRLYHAKDSYYGRVIDGHLLGAGAPRKQQP